MRRVILPQAILNHAQDHAHTPSLARLHNLSLGSCRGKRGAEISCAFKAPSICTFSSLFHEGVQDDHGLSRTYLFSGPIRTFQRTSNALKR